MTHHQDFASIEHHRGTQPPSRSKEGWWKSWFNHPPDQFVATKTQGFNDALKNRAAQLLVFDHFFWLVIFQFTSRLKSPCYLKVSATGQYFFNHSPAAMLGPSAAPYLNSFSHIFWTNSNISREACGAGQNLFRYPTWLWLLQFANWKMAIEIVDLPIKNGDFP